MKVVGLDGRRFPDGLGFGREVANIDWLDTAPAEQVKFFADGGKGGFMTWVDLAVAFDGVPRKGWWFDGHCWSR